MKYDFCGWASKNNLKCSDGRVILKDAFKGNDGERKPLVWGHRHDGPGAVLGHAILENREEGVYAYCCFNNTQAGKDARECVEHGDVETLSIWANNLVQDGPNVKSGSIREVSLVLAGANPGAFIESVVAHNMPMGDEDEEGIFYSGETLVLEHGTLSHEEGSKKGKEGGDPPGGDEPSVSDVLDTLTDEQKQAVGVVISQLEAGKEGGDQGSNTEGSKKEGDMKHNIFDKGKEKENKNFLSHDDMKTLITDAKKCGSFRDAVHQHMQDGVLVHADFPTEGLTVGPGTSTYGIDGISMLFPDYKSLTPTPEFISRRMDWVEKVMSRVHHTPFSRVKSLFADITADEARAKGYIKGKLKKEEVISLLKRTTDPKTVYKKQKLDRDDILDMEKDFNVIPWLRAEMHMMLREEIARAILIGDGRLASSEDKISEDHIRPVATEHDLFAVKVPVNVSSSATEEEIAKAIVRAAIKGRKLYKGRGTPDFWTTDDYVTDMLLLENAIGDRQYKTEAELATAIRASEIISVEPMEGNKITVNGTQYPLIGIMTNLGDYNVGTDKGGEVTDFDDFDIDYNQQIYLSETRMSGALIRPFSALVFYLNKGSNDSGSEKEEEGDE